VIDEGCFVAIRSLLVVKDSTLSTLSLILSFGASSEHKCPSDALSGSRSRAY